MASKLFCVIFILSSIVLCKASSIKVNDGFEWIQRPKVTRFERPLLPSTEIVEEHQQNQETNTGYSSGNDGFEWIQRPRITQLDLESIAPSSSSSTENQDGKEKISGFEWIQRPKITQLNRPIPSFEIPDEGVQYSRRHLAPKSAPSPN